MEGEHVPNNLSQPLISNPHLIPHLASVDQDICASGLYIHVAFNSDHQSNLAVVQLIRSIASNPCSRSGNAHSVT